MFWWTKLLPSRQRHRGVAKLILVIGGALFSIAIFAGIFAWMMSGPVLNPEARLNNGLRLLKQGEIQEAMLRAASIDEELLERPADKAKHHLLFGAATLEDAEHAQVRQTAIKKAKESRKHLEKAGQIGFPRGYEGLGSYLLGKVLFFLMQWDEAVEPLEAAISEWPSGRIGALERLMDIELGSPHPDIPLLRSRLAQWDGLAGLTPDEREREELKRIEVELADGEVEVARQLAEDFPEASIYADNAKYLMALAELQRIEAASEKLASDLEKVFETMQMVSRSPRVDGVTRRRSKYYSGLIQQKLNQPQKALTIFSSLRQEAPQTIESTIAAIEEVQSLINLARFADASKTMRLLSDQFGELEWYQNHWVPIDRMRQRTKELGQSLLQAKAYPEAVAYSEHLPPYVERVDVLKLSAEAYRQWALSLKGKAWRDEPLMDIRQAANAPVEESNPNKLQHELFSKAAKAFKELAVIEMRSPEYQDLQWAAIDCSQAAGELAQSNALINEAMSFEPRDRQPRSILKMAENHYALQEFDKSLMQLRRCIDQHPRNPIAFQSRLNAARILSEQSDFDPATTYLEENLYGTDLTPNSPVWRESLFELGKLYYRRGEEQFSAAAGLRDATLADQKAKLSEALEGSHEQFLKSIERLEEWIKRYPEDERRFDTLYTIGQAYQMAAQWNTHLLNEKLLQSDDQIRLRRIEQRKLLDSARQMFKDIRDGINATRDWAMLDPAQQRVLRNSYFAEADLTYQMKNYEGALVAYRNIANRLLNEPEALEALTQAAECLKQLGRTEESRRLISQARDVLEQIPTSRDPQFLAFTRFSRNDWSKHLDWMSQNTL
jgi:tetratricopeptide (TPR) repeat protein